MGKLKNIVKRYWKRLVSALLTGLVAGFLIQAFIDSGHFESFVYNLRGPIPGRINNNISVVALDPAILNERYNPKTGKIDREVYRQLISRIAAEKPRVIILDILLRSDDTAEDLALANELAAMGPVLLADRFKVENGKVEFLLSGKSELAESPKTGYVNLPVEPGRVVRAIMSTLDIDRAGWSHVALTAGRMFLQTDDAVVTPTRIVLINRDLLKPRIDIPLRPDGHAHLHFRGTSHSVIKASTLLADTDPAMIKSFCSDKIVLIGATDERLGDLLLTPIHLRNPALPPLFGVEILATAVDNIISGDFLAEPSAMTRLGYMLLAALLAFLIMAWGTVARLLTGSVASLAILFAAISAFNKGVLLDPLPIMAAVMSPLFLPMIFGDALRRGQELFATAITLIKRNEIDAAITLLREVPAEAMAHTEVLEIINRLHQVGRSEDAIDLYERYLLAFPTDEAAPAKGQRAIEQAGALGAGLATDEANVAPEPVVHRDVFLSYRSVDHDLAFAIVRHLESKGLKCWIAPRNIIPGRSFPTEIMAGLDNTSMLVLLFTAPENLSRHILSEVSRAFDLGRPIIVFKTCRALPDKTFSYFLGLAHWLDTTAGTPEQSFDELEKAVRIHIADQQTKVEKSD